MVASGFPFQRGVSHSTAMPCHHVHPNPRPTADPCQNGCQERCNSTTIVGLESTQDAKPRSRLDVHRLLVIAAHRSLRADRFIPWER